MSVGTVDWILDEAVTLQVGANSRQRFEPLHVGHELGKLLNCLQMKG